MAANAMALRTEYRGAISALVSVILHAALLIALAVTSIDLASGTRQVIPLAILEPAPPPPPPGGGGAGQPAPAAEVEAPKLVDQPKPIEAPQPVERPKIAARPKPKPERARPQPTPAANVPPPIPEVASAPAQAGGDAASGVGGGVVGGVAGGQVGGKIGGRVGGTGDDVWSLDQVAVPPKLLDAMRPQYPPLARARGQEGVVVVQAIIDRRGAVEPDSLHVIKSQPPFDDAAVAALRQATFQPGRDGTGTAVRVLVQQRINFRLR